jgi:hypothetical protein
MSVSNPLVETNHYQTAQKFIAALRITKNRWLPQDSKQVPWLFRGHSDAEWELIPSSWRSRPPGKPISWAEQLKERILGKFERPIEQAVLAEKRDREPNKAALQEFLIHIERNPNLEKVLLQAIFEIEAVQYFTEFVDRLGFPVPRARTTRLGSDVNFNWEDIISGAVTRLRDSVKRSKPHQPIWLGNDLPVVVLARHHGIPVSLLDWTRKPLIAAFFAADDLVNLSATPERLAVWAIHTDVVGGRDHRLQFPELPRSELGFLHAQDGVLTHDVGADHFFINSGRWPTILDAVDETPHSIYYAPLRKITLPTSQAKELLRLLWSEGISRPHLMPTFDNITESLKKNYLWF